MLILALPDIKLENINYRVAKQKVVIIGLGGTGSYILDFLSKNPLKEIHIYDSDLYKNHNAFRAPGAISSDDLKKGYKKVTYYKNIYSKMHKNIIGHDHFEEGNLTDLNNKDFIFFCAAGEKIRETVTKYLLKQNIAFIDVGLGIDIRAYDGNQEKMSAKVRVTAVSKNMKNINPDVFKTYGDGKERVYNNVQTAELNALNACLAIIRWKQLMGLYHCENHEENNILIYDTDYNKIIKKGFK